MPNLDVAMGDGPGGGDWGRVPTALWAATNSKGLFSVCWLVQVVLSLFLLVSPAMNRRIWQGRCLFLSYSLPAWTLEK